MSFAYNEAKRAFFAGEINLASDDIRVMLVMSDTTCDTEDDADTFAGFTTIDELSATGYTTNGVALTGEAIGEDSPNDRAEFTANNASWTGLADGVRQVVAAILYKWNTTQADSEPLAYIDDGAAGFPFDGGDADVTIQWNAEGILQST